MIMEKCRICTCHDEAIVAALSLYAFCLFTVKQNTCAIMKSNSWFAVFDSHARNVQVVNYRDMMPEVCARNTSMTADLQVREINRHESRNDGHGESVQAIVFGESSVVRPVAIVTPRIRLTLQVNTPVEEPVEEDITDHLEAGYTPPDINNDEAVYTPPASDSEDGYTDEELEPPYITLLGGEEEYPNDLFIQYMQVKDTLVFALEDLGFSERQGGAPPLSVCSYTPCSGVLAHH
ncbi:uncharacterized protein LOC143485710 isoform X1 [Brachyhypopomus gauderio]|uniref:uncharacterized protein LOC143485710 isoform X1 n=2 Tax=Brachyhypopomus gauderio TaxID=698409 RepID=UPI0040438970